MVVSSWFPFPNRKRATKEIRAPIPAALLLRSLEMEPDNPRRADPGVSWFGPWLLIATALTRGCPKLDLFVFFLLKTPFKRGMLGDWHSHNQHVGRRSVAVKG